MDNESMSHRMMNPRGVIFDLDGTLVSTLSDIATAINKTREFLGLPVRPEEEITCLVGNGTAHLVRETIEMRPEAFDRIHEQYLEFYDQHLLDQSRPYEGVVDTLERYEEKILAVITNKPIQPAEKILRGLNLWNHFKLVLGGDSLERKKPDPLPLTHFLEKFQLKPDEVVIVGDGINDIRSGKAAGIKTIGATWGVSTREELIAEQADYLIDSMHQLGDLVE